MDGRAPLPPGDHGVVPADFTASRKYFSSLAVLSEPSSLNGLSLGLPGFARRMVRSSAFRGRTRESRQRSRQWIRPLFLFANLISGTLTCRDIEPHLIVSCEWIVSSVIETSERKLIDASV